MTRKSSIFIGAVVIEAALLALLFLQGAAARRSAEPALERRAALVRALGLTDLCLVTEARYTRHPSLADRHVPFQDSPLSFEHFPSGSFIAPPEHLRARP